MKKIASFLISSLLFVLMAAGTCSAALPPDFDNTEKPLLVKTWFAQPNCTPDIEDSWYRDVFAMVQNELGNRNIEVVDSIDAWTAFSADKTGRTLNRDTVRKEYNMYINQNYAGILNITVDKYVTHPNGLSEVSVTVSCDRNNGGHSSFKASSAMSGTGKTRMQLLNRCLIDLL